MGSYQTVNYSVEGAIALIALNRPEALNTFNRALQTELFHAVTAANSDDSVRVVVLTGEGRGFSAGADLKDSFTQYHDNVTDHLVQDHFPTLDAIRAAAKPYIAAINGPCAGIGVGYAMACDLAIMAESAYCYQAFAAIALVPDGGVSWHLVEALGYKRAFQAIVEGEKLDSAQCLAAGMVNKVVPDAELRSAALAWAHKLAGGAPLALRNVKQILREAVRARVEETMQQEARAQHTCFESADAKEGVTAFLEKRKPVFSGR